jgi:hypothetical protein
LVCKIIEKTASCTLYSKGLFVYHSICYFSNYFSTSVVPKQG